MSEKGISEKFEERKKGNKKAAKAGKRLAAGKADAPEEDGGQKDKKVKIIDNAKSE